MNCSFWLINTKAKVEEDLTPTPLFDYMFIVQFIVISLLNTPIFFPWQLHALKRRQSLLIISDITIPDITYSIN